MAGGSALNVATALLAMRDGIVPGTAYLDDPVDAPGVDLVQQSRVQDLDSSSSWPGVSAASTAAWCCAGTARRKRRHDGGNGRRRRRGADHAADADPGGCEAQFEEAWRRAAAEISRVPGNLRQELVRDADDPRTFLITSRLGRPGRGRRVRPQQRPGALTAALRDLREDASRSTYEVLYTVDAEKGRHVRVDITTTVGPGEEEAVRAGLQEDRRAAARDPGADPGGAAQGAGGTDLPHLRRVGDRAGLQQLGRRPVARRPDRIAHPVAVGGLRAAGLRDPLPAAGAPQRRLGSGLDAGRVVRDGAAGAGTGSAGAAGHGPATVVPSSVGARAGRGGAGAERVRAGVRREAGDRPGARAGPGDRDERPAGRRAGRRGARRRRRARPA
jgi:hypothetical protein